MNLNKVMIAGRLTRDPEIRVTPKGTSICQLGLAINRDWKTESGEKQTEVLFVDVEAWGKQAEVVAKYFAKGREIFVEGRLRLDQWEDKNTKEKRSRMKVVLESFQFVGSARDQGGEGGAPQAQQTPAKQPGTKPANENLDEEVPF